MWTLFLVFVFPLFFFLKEKWDGGVMVAEAHVTAFVISYGYMEGTRVLKSDPREKWANKFVSLFIK